MTHGGHEVAAILPAAPDADFDRMAQLARRVLGVPSATVCVITPHAHVVPGAAGIPADLDETRSVSLDYSICKNVVRDAKPLIVDDARCSAELAGHPAVVEMGIRAYAGIPLRDVDDSPVGSLAVFDTEPRTWSATDVAVLADLAAACGSQLKLRQLAARAAVVGERDRIATQLQQGVITALFQHSLELSTARSYATGPVADRLADAIEQVDAIIVSLRSSIYELA